MATPSLPEALTSLSPVDFSTVPLDDPSLQSFLEEHLSAAHLLVESVPPPQEPSAPISPLPMSSSAILPPSSASNMASAMQSLWGKPLKIAPKDNPLSIPVYKLAARDGRGAWFARRSVHSGLNFDRWSEAIQREFPTSLAVKGAPGEGNVRGIGADERLERIEVEGCGRLDVYRLSAQFPGPTTPRDFVELLIVSDTAPKQSIGNKGAGRHLIIISKPCAHPEAEPSSGFIRGSYESVEFIREIPLAPKSSKSAVDLRSLAVHQDGEPLAHATSSPFRPTTARLGPSDAPVEWIHISRSDPGGSVPRFMVERGTPGSMVADAKKFVDWASSIDLSAQVPSAEEEEKEEKKVAEAEPASLPAANGTTDASAGETPSIKSVPAELDGHPAQPSHETSTSDSLPGSWTSPPPPPPPQLNTSQARRDAWLFSSLSSATTSVAHAAWSQLGSYAPDLTGGFGSRPAPLGRSNSIVPSPRPDRRYSSSSSSSSGDSSDSKDSDLSDDGSFASAAASPLHSPLSAQPSSLVSDPSLETSSQDTRYATLAENHSARLVSLASELASTKEKYASDAKRVEKAEAQHSRTVEKAEAQHHKAVAALQATQAKEVKRNAERTAKQTAKQSAKQKSAAEKLDAANRKAAKKQLDREQREMRRQRERAERNERSNLRDEVKALKADLAKVRNEKEAIANILGRVQAENTALIARVDKLEGGKELLEDVKRGGGLALAAGMEKEESVRSGKSNMSTKSTKSTKSIKSIKREESGLSTKSLQKESSAKSGNGNGNGKEKGKEKPSFQGPGE